MLMGRCLLDRIKLICLPHAGGSSLIYNNWKKQLSSKIEIYSPELQGRGTRYKEEHPEKLNILVNDIYKNIEKVLTDNDYALFGHSMGALIVYELYKKIKSNNISLPKALFLSGMYPPPTNIKEFVHLYSDEQILEKIKKLGGTPKTILKNKRFMEYYIPIIRADYKMIETYEYKEIYLKITEPTFIFSGKKDSIPKDLIMSWKNHTLFQPTYYEFDGGHFFIHENSKEVLNAIESILLHGGINS